MMFSPDKYNALPLAWTNPLHWYGLGQGAALLDRTQVFWWLLGQTWSSREPWQRWRLTVSLAASTEVYSKDQGSNLFPLRNTCKITPRVLHPDLGPWGRKDMEKLEGAQGKAPKAVGAGALAPWGEAGRAGAVSAWRTDSFGGTWQPSYTQLFYYQMYLLISMLLILFLSPPWFLILYSNLALQFSSYSIMPEQFDLLCNSTIYIILQGQC